MTLPADLQTGQSEVDRQHTALLSEFDLLSTAMSEPELPSLAHIMEFINFLRNHFTSHFDMEESLMHEVNYPEWMSHTEAHLSFFDKFVYHRACIEKYGAQPEVVNQFVEAMREWIRDHVLGHDVKFAQYYRAAVSHRTQTGT